MSETYGLFATPLTRVPGLLPPDLVRGLAQHFSAVADQPNNASSALTHTRMLQPSDSALLIEVARRAEPELREFGALLFGERMAWSLKEMWVNFLAHGGQQAMHNHANSFVSGVVYLSPCDPSARTVFMKPPAGSDFIFKNDHAGSVTGPYNADKWISPLPEPGDAVLFPSYLLHAVPPNQGERRITLAFNAIPARLESWGYTMRFAG